MEDLKLFMEANYVKERDLADYFGVSVSTISRRINHRHVNNTHDDEIKQAICILRGDVYGENY